MSTPSILESASAIESALSALRVACRGMVAEIDRARKVAYAQGDKAGVEDVMAEGSGAGARTRKVELEQLAAAALEDRDPPFDLVDLWRRRSLTTTRRDGGRAPDHNAAARASAGPQKPLIAMDRKVI
jgi:hypothetical protein